MATIKPKKVTLTSGKEVCVRVRQVEDTPAVMEYMDAILADDQYFMTTAPEAQVWKTPEKINERTAETLENPNSLLLVVEDHGKILSTSDIECNTKERDQHVGNVGISVLPGYRGLGLDKAIMQVMIDWAMAHPVIEKLALAVWSDKSLWRIRINC